jgi:hypothetical protein
MHARTHARTYNAYLKTFCQSSLGLCLVIRVDRKTVERLLKHAKVFPVLLNQIVFFSFFLFQQDHFLS